MTTSHQKAVEAVRAQALALHQPGQTLAFATDAETYRNAKTPAVLVAIVREHASVVLAVDLTEWNGVEFLKLAGFPDAVPLSAHERAVKAA